MKKGPKFLSKTLISYWKKLLGEVKQKEEQATYCQKIEKKDWEINIKTDILEDIYKQYRAYALRPKIYFFLETNNWKIKRIVIEKLILNEDLFSENKNQLLMKWKKLNVCIQDIAIKPEWKKTMSRDAFKTWYLK
jgi:methionyl-tRNA formyltransferase